jgi:hypothetical protein
VFFEERDDSALEISEGAYRVLVHRFSVIVLSRIAANRAATEISLEKVKRLCAPLALHHRERRLDLPTKPTRMVPKDRNAEAAFSVYEADYPLRKFWPFLLIVRTGRIVTAHVRTLRTGCDMHEYRQILGVSSK